jgi:hypothetical protein
MTGFTVIWAGQFVSLLGASMTNFHDTVAPPELIRLP